MAVFQIEINVFEYPFVNFCIA